MLGSLFVFGGGVLVFITVFMFVLSFLSYGSFVGFAAMDFECGFFSGDYDLGCSSDSSVFVMYLCVLSLLEMELLAALLLVFYCNWFSLCTLMVVSMLVESLCSELFINYVE